MILTRSKALWPPALRPASPLDLAALSPRPRGRPSNPRRPNITCIPTSVPPTTASNAVRRPGRCRPSANGWNQFFGGVDWLFDKTGHYYLPDDMPGSPGVNERTREREIQRADYWHNVRTAEDLLIIPFGYVMYRIVQACLRSCFGRRQHRHQQVQGPTFWDRAKLSLLGPTTVHLRYECALLLCNALLTSAALVSIYRGGFGSLGDLRYVALTVLVMSRHVALRWLCLNDTSTSSHPTVMGTIAKILSTFCAAGQVFDSPPHRC